MVAGLAGGAAALRADPSGPARVEYIHALPRFTTLYKVLNVQDKTHAEIPLVAGMRMSGLNLGHQSVSLITPY